jgi:hypothetical protein
VHRQEITSRLDGLFETTEHLRLSQAADREQLSQFEEGLGLCLEGMKEVRTQSGACEKRVVALDAVVRSSLDELRSGIGRIEEQCHLQHETSISAMRQGDQTVADELLRKMAELNEKLGLNMQTLEEELSTAIESAVRNSKEDSNTTLCLSTHNIFLLFFVHLPMHYYNHR